MVKSPKSKGKVKKKNKVEANGRAFVKATFNNTIVSLTDNYGNVIAWASGGIENRFKGSRKNTAFASQMATEGAVKRAMDLGLRKVAVFVKGPGPGRDAAIRTLQNAGLQVVSIKDVTPLPHNGCRPKKKRRI